MPDFTWSNWPMGVDLNLLVSEALVHAHLSDFNHLNQADGTLRDEEMAQLVNNAIENYLDHVPYLGRKNATVTLAASTSAYSMETDLSGQHIERVQMADGRELDYKPLDQIYSDLDHYTRNGTVVYDEPVYWSYDAEANQLVLLPESSVTPSQNAVVIYRALHTAIETADVTDRATEAVPIGEIPKRHKHVLAKHLAKDLVERMGERADKELERYELNYAKALREAQEHYLNNDAISYRSTLPGAVRKSARF